MAGRSAAVRRVGRRVWVEPSREWRFRWPPCCAGRHCQCTPAHAGPGAPTPADLVLRAGDESPDGMAAPAVQGASAGCRLAACSSDFDDFVAFDIETSDFDIDTARSSRLPRSGSASNVVVGGSTAWWRARAADLGSGHRGAWLTDGDLVGAPPMCRGVAPFPRASWEPISSSPIMGRSSMCRCCGALCRDLEGFEELVFYDTLASGSRRWSREAPGSPSSRPEVQCRGGEGAPCASMMPSCWPAWCRRSTSCACGEPERSPGPPARSARPGARAGPATSPTKEETLFRDITRPFTLGRYSDCLDTMPPSWLGRRRGRLGLEEVIERLGGRALMERLRAERPVNERYPDGGGAAPNAGTGESGRTLSAEQIEECPAAAPRSPPAQVPKPTQPGLNLLTLHSTKGLEFSRVYVVGVENQVLPGWRAIQEDRERRDPGGPAPALRGDDPSQASPGADACRAKGWLPGSGASFHHRGGSGAGGSWHTSCIGCPGHQ